MSIYEVKGSGWRYDFTYQKKRYTSTFLRTKREAMQAEAKRKEELKNPKPIMNDSKDMEFYKLVAKRLFFLENFRSARHFKENCYLSKRWCRWWKNPLCSQITKESVESFLLTRKKISNYTANMDLRNLRAMFNFGLKNGYIFNNPCDGIGFFLIEKKFYKPTPPENIDKIIEVADPDTQDYLWTIRDTMARVGEINRLTWDDVVLNGVYEGSYVILKSRKTKGGNLTPRTVYMTRTLFDILSNRFERRDIAKPWVFWHRYWDKKEKKFVEGPYKQRKRLMKNLCEKAGVEHIGFHALRHSGASIMEDANIPLGEISRTLGHSCRKTTEIYLHSIGNANRIAMDRYEHARKKSHINSHIECWN